MRHHVLAGFALACLCSTPAYSAELDDRVRALEERAAAQQKQIEELGGQPGKSAPAPGLFGGAALTNPYLSLILNTYA